MVALGTNAAGIMGNDDTLVKNLINTAERNGERYWELPLWDEYFDSLKSDIADMKNTGSRWGGASTAGVFLKKFVKDVKWAHIDIAGVAFLDKPQKEFIKGATGAGVRTLLNNINKGRDAKHPALLLNLYLFCINKCYFIPQNICYK